MGRYWGGFYDKTHVQIFNIDILRKIGEKYDFSLVSAKTYFTGTLIESMIRRLNIPEGRFRMFCFYIFSCIYFSLSFIQDLRKN
jgi:hypothetical protein